MDILGKEISGGNHIRRCNDQISRLPTQAFSYFFTTYLAAIDTHSIVSAFDIDTRKSVSVLSSFCLAFATFQQHEVGDIPRLPTPSLFEEVSNGNVSVYALFGGQGINEVYFDELQKIYDIYKAFVEAFLEAAVVALKPLAEAHQSSSVCTHGLDVLAWLNGTQPVSPALPSFPSHFPSSASPCSSSSSLRPASRGCRLLSSARVWLARLAILKAFSPRSACRHLRTMSRIL